MIVVMDKDHSTGNHQSSSALKDFHDAGERYLSASSIPVESQPGMVANGKPVPAGMLSPSSGASSGRISLIGAGPGGPEEPEE